MAGSVWEFFGFQASDNSDAALRAAEADICPVLAAPCEKKFADGVRTGGCAIKPVTSPPVICCPIRLYAENYKVLQDVSDIAFGVGLTLVPGQQAVEHVKAHAGPCVAMFGKKWGGELRLPQKSGRGGYFVDWVLAKIDSNGALEEFVAVEVQTIDTTGSYRSSYEALKAGRSVLKSTVGLNWENVSKRILPQLVYKGQVLQREEKCRKGLFFICPDAVFASIAERLGGLASLPNYPFQPASITFLTYAHDSGAASPPGEMVPLRQVRAHSTTIYKLQEAFNNVTLSEDNVYRRAIEAALGD